jgi:flavodoxin I
MKIAVVYASMSGNTEAIAEFITNELTENNFEVDLIDMLSLKSASEILDYNMAFIGMYTWGDGDYPDECLDIIEELEELELNQFPFALFGSGDTSYPEFCGALDQLQKLLIKQGGIMTTEPLRIHLNPNKEDQIKINEYVQQAIQFLSLGS